MPDVIEVTEVIAEPRAALENARLAQLMIGHYQGFQLEQLAGYARAHENDEFAGLEVAALLHISDGAARSRLRFARTLTERLPETFAALRQGFIEEYKAKLIADAVEPLSDEHASAVETRVLGKAGQQTQAQLRNTLAKVVLAVDPEGAERRRHEKLRDRRVESKPTEPGMAMLTVHDSADRVAAMHGVITARARALKAAGGETRTLRQLEADIAHDLILGTQQPGGRVIEVHLTLPATTAAGADDQPGDVDGLPVTAQAARELLREASSWRWVRTDPATGAVRDLTYPRYTPPAALSAYLQVRDDTCRFPGCTRRARRCDIDHRVPWPRGATSTANCICLCRQHHRAKHEGGWTVRPIAPDWYEWESPAGFTHATGPEPAATPRPPAPDPDPHRSEPRLRTHGPSEPDDQGRPGTPARRSVSRAGSPRPGSGTAWFRSTFAGTARKEPRRRRAARSRRSPHRRRSDSAGRTPVSSRSSCSPGMR